QLLVVELAPSVLELADADRLEEALPGAHPVERPLPGGERVQPDGEGVETSAGPLELVLLDVPVAAPDRAAHRRACPVAPLFRSGERALEAADPQLPGAMEEVEVVPAVVRLSRRLWWHLRARPAGCREEAEHGGEHEDPRDRVHVRNSRDKNGCEQEPI